MSHQKTTKSYNCFLMVHETVRCFIKQNTVLLILLIIPFNPTVRAACKCTAAWLANGFLHHLYIGLGWEMAKGAF